MKRFDLARSLLLPLLAALLWGCATQKRLASPPPTAGTITDLPAVIDAILQDSALTQTRTGIKVVSLASGETLYRRDSQLLFHPASNMKLLTTATALKRLGPNFRFKTVLLADSAAVGDSLITGPLYLKGHGNPDLLDADLRWMATELAARGIRRVTGHLICDETYMDDLYWGNGWMWDDVSDWYWAPISALTVNDNCVEITVKPGKTPGEPLAYRLEPQTGYMQVQNNGITVDSTDTLRHRDFKVQRLWKQPANVIVIEGGRYPADEERTYTIDVIDAARYTGTRFSELLRETGVSFSGQVVKGETPPNAVVLVEHLSPALTEAVINTNKISDNLSAELLLKTIGAEMRGTPGTAKKGIREIYRFLQEAGVDSTRYELADGSGVSRYNVITPDLLIELLRAMHADFRIAAEFQTSLPIAGVDGTLENRMKETPAAGKLRAKTGSLRGVSALSGYTTSAEGEPLAFSIIMEHFVVRTAKIRAIQDRIGAALSAFARQTAE